MEEFELIKQIQKNRTSGKTAREKYSDEWDRCYDYYEGSQTPSGLPEYAKYFCLNLIRKRLDSILGALLRFKYTAVLKPRGDEDIPKVDFYKKIVEYILDRTKAWVEETKAIFQQYMVGIGWIQIYWDKDKSPLGDITWAMRDAYTIWFDPYVKREDLSDARWIGREERFTVEDIKLLWPGKANLVIANDVDTLEPLQEASGAEEEDRATVIEYQYYTEDKKKLYYKDGELVEAPKKLTKKEASQYDIIEKIERTHWKAHMCGDVLLDNEPTDLSRFDLIPFYHAKRKDSSYPIGEVENWTHWQDLINVFYSLLLNYVARSGKLTGVVEGGTREFVDTLRKDVAEPGGIAWVPTGASFKPWVAPPLPSAFDVVLKDLRNAWDDLTAYYDVQRGETPWAGISGKAITQLQHAGSLAYVLGEHHINNSITTCGRLMLELIGKHMTVEQAWRLTSNEGLTPVNQYLGKAGELSPEEKNQPMISQRENSETGEIEYYLNDLKDIAQYDLKIEVDSLKEQTKREKEEMAIALIQTNAEDGKPLVDREFVLNSLGIAEKNRIIQRMRETDQLMQMGQMVLKNPFLMELIQNPELMARIQQAMGAGPQGGM